MPLVRQEGPSEGCAALVELKDGVKENQVPAAGPGAFGASAKSSPPPGTACFGIGAFAEKIGGAAERLVQASYPLCQGRSPGAPASACRPPAAPSLSRPLR